MSKYLTTTVKKSSMRGVVLSYIISAPGEETVRTITEDLYNGLGTKKKVYNSVLEAATNLRQRGLVDREGKNMTNGKLFGIDGAIDCLT